MATPTYIPLATVTLPSSSGLVNFNSISQDYRDLVLIIDNNGSDQQGRIQFNSDSGSNYSRVHMNGTGSSTSSDTGTSSYIFVVPTITVQHAVIEIMDYSATDKHKTVLIRGGKATGETGVFAVANRWADTSAITSLTYFVGGSFIDGATATLYGIAGVA